MKLNMVFKASCTFSAEQENTCTCNSAVRFHLHLRSERDSLVQKKHTIRKESVGRFTILLHFSAQCITCPRFLH